MSIPQEQDYIGLSEPLLVEKISKNEKNSILDLKETELRLGLPGSESPERKVGNGVSIFGKDLKNCGSGAKRGFCDAINGCGQWVLSVNGGSELDLVKVEHVLFSPVKEACKNPSGEEKKNGGGVAAPASKAQVVGWPPVRSFLKNSLATNLSKNGDITGKSGPCCLFVKVSMDGAPYLRKIDLNTYCSYAQLSPALEKMFSCFTIGQYGHGVSGKEHLSESRLIDLLHGSEYVLTYEDKDGDWMLVGDVPWKMFVDSCKRLRIMKGSDAIGLAPRTMLKCKSQN